MPARAARLAAVLLLLPPCVPSAAQPVAAAPVSVPLSGTFAQGALVRGQAPSGALRVTLDGKPVPLDPGGAFLLGFDRDHGPSAMLAVELAGGAIIRQPLTI